MKFTRRHKKKSNTGLKSSQNHKPELESCRIGDWEKQWKPIHRTFNGPRNVSIPLRISFEKVGFSEIIQHAKESLDTEICGVFVGQVCKDEEGLFVTVEAVIRGKAALGRRTHVTFTQDTWNAIHAEKDSKYAKLKIVGWYHSHPGFGVDLSDMDRFIHKNFFSSEVQIGLITDPLSGNIAVFINSDRGVIYIDRIWIDGREHKCHVPTTVISSNVDSIADTSIVVGKIEDINVRLSQTIQTLDELRTMYFRFLTITFMIVTITVVVLIGYNIYSSISAKYKSPEMRSFVPVPVQIGDKTVLLGVGIYNWEVPPELNATYLQIEKMALEIAEKADLKAKEGEDQQNKQNGNQEVPKQ